MSAGRCRCGDVRASKSHQHKPVKRRVVTTWTSQRDASAEPVPIYVSASGSFYCYLGAVEVSGWRLDAVRRYLGEHEEQLDRAALRYVPMICLSAHNGTLRVSRLLYAIDAAGKTYMLDSRTGRGPGAWRSRLLGDDWQAALREGADKGLVYVSEREITDGLVPYTPEAWENAKTLRAEYSRHLRRIDKALQTRAGELLRDASPLRLSAKEEEGREREEREERKENLPRPKGA